MKKNIALLTFSASLISLNVVAQGDPKATEVWEPEPKVVKTGAVNTPPSDAVILFDGKNLNEWESVKDIT